MQDTLKRLSHRMSALLRHRAGEVALRMDAAGWVELDDLVAHLGELSVCPPDVAGAAAPRVSPR
jgi:RNA:NAD 2'-phosphotransferase (TPT1/KptA family)